MKASGESPVISFTIGRYLSTLDEGNQARWRRKFDVHYAMAKESILFAKYPALLALEACHGELPTAHPILVQAARVS